MSPAGAAIRAIVVALSAWAGADIAMSADLPLAAGAAAGAAMGAGAIWIEARVVRVPVERLFWGSIGGFFGVIAGLAVGIAFAALIPNAGIAALGLPALLGGYLGVATMIRRRADFAPVSAVLFPAATRGAESRKVVDTSVLIDGRLADLCDTGFVEGVLVVPQFVLRELQQIADSSDPLRRARGRRGFDVLQRLQRSPRVKVEIADADPREVREVDRKLVEVARAMRAKVVTNDQNLTRLAEVSGVSVLNVNELTNALRPVVLPGEMLQVQVLREGREAGQGVAYLDDGTMVVVDHGRKHVGQTVEVTVTSVLQTSAGRMIFTRLRAEEPVPGARHG